MIFSDNEIKSCDCDSFASDIENTVILYEILSVL